MSRQKSYATRFRINVKLASKTHKLVSEVGQLLKPDKIPGETTKEYHRENSMKKRTYEESFGTREYDFERYGQEIDADYFATNIGHAAIT